MLGAPEVSGDCRAKLCKVCKHTVGQPLGIVSASGLTQDPAGCCAPDDDLAASLLKIPDVALVVQHIVIRSNQAGDNGLAQSTGCIDQDRLSVAADWIGGEHDARDLGVDHALDDDRDLDICLLNTNSIAVCDCAVGPQ
jgi:hypothetical protein